MDNLMLTSLREMLEAELHRLSEMGKITGGDIAEQWENAADATDRATMESDRSFTLLMNDRNRAKANEIRCALMRFDTGEYGACVECGDDISIARLRAHPMAVLCVHCQSAKEDEVRLQRAAAV